MKGSSLILLITFALLLSTAGQAYGQALSDPGVGGPIATGSAPPPPIPAEGTGRPDHVSPDFPAAPGTDFPGSIGSGDFPPTKNPEGMDTTMPESGSGTGTDSTLGGSGTGSGGLGTPHDPFTYGPTGGR